ncbi:MAG: formylglycine-generating enzyme family protein [Bacteroidetes bacterium]|nr:formylglycine-generating enzyme family protein [Bacteroidota bacterium]
MQEVYTEFKNTPAEFKMVYVEGGVFEMGSNEYNNAMPVHKVQISSFWMGEFVVTQAVWAYVMTDKTNPSHFKRINHPVENVTYRDIVKEFLPRLNNITGREYRLPTEAEWEYAAKGGKYSRKHPFEYAGSNKLDEVGWYNKNSYGETKVIGLKTPNLLGLYDMSGNVWEWCYDWFYSNFYNIAAWGLKLNPKGSKNGKYRVLRGGSWDHNLQNGHVTFRFRYTPISFNDYVGFRLVLSSLAQ